MRTDYNIEYFSYHCPFPGFVVTFSFSISHVQATSIIESSLVVCSCRPIRVLCVCPSEVEAIDTYPVLIVFDI